MTSSILGQMSFEKGPLSDQTAEASANLKKLDWHRDLTHIELFKN
jgi:hypothetical protein